MVRSVLGSPVARVPVEGRGPDGPYRYYGHKGFDYRELAREIEERFMVSRRIFTPMPRLGAAVNSQVWFLCAPR